MLAEVVLKLVGVFGDVERDEGDSAWQRVYLLRSLNKSFIQVEAQEVNFPPIRLFLRHQMFVESSAQFLPFTG